MFTGIIDTDRVLATRHKTVPVRLVIAVLAAILLAQPAAAQKTVSFPTEDGGVVFADVYGASDRAVVLAHGGRFNKESWAAQAGTLVAAGFEVLAIDFRGFGKSHGPTDKNPPDPPFQLDVLAAVRYLHKNGAKSFSIIGGSMGGSAAGDASILSQPGELIASYCSARHPTVQPRSSSRQFSSSWRATTRKAMANSAYPEFERSMRKLRSRRN